MLQQQSFKPIVKLFGIMLQHQTKFAILFLSLVLTACGGTSEKTTPLEEPGPDGVAPSLTGTANSVRGERPVFANAVNKCNLGKKVASDQTILVQVSASESVLAPNVTIADMPVKMSGSGFGWSGEFELDQLPAGQFANGDNIPYVITVTDSSGEVSAPYTATPNSDEALKFCDPEIDPDKCACYPEDISGVWKLAQKARAMGVGQSEGNTGDWAVTDFHLSQRDCLFDDTYTFVVDSGDPSKKKGSFYQEMDEWTWLEPWQSGDVERCGLPQTPFDGSTEDMSYEWDRDKGTLTLRGLGAHIALPRVANDEENTGTPVDEVVYTLETANSCFISFNIKSGGPSPWWHFEIEKSENLDGTPCETGQADSAPVTGSVPAPPIFSTEYEGMPAADVLLDLTATYSSDMDAEIQPTVTNEGTTFNVPAVYFVDPDGDGEEDNPGAYAGFANNPDPESKLYTYDGVEAGTAYLQAVADNDAASAALIVADNEFLLSPEDEALEAAANEAAETAKAAAKALRDSSYFSNSLTFGSGGYIYFKGSVPSGVNAELYFKIDHYEVDPLTGDFTTVDDENGNSSRVLVESFDTDPVTIKGSETGFYGVKIDAKEEQGNIISMVINTPDVDVVITDIRVITTVAADESIRGPYYFTNVFSGATVGDDPDTEAVEENTPLGTDGKLLGEDNAWLPIEITNEGTTFNVPSAYFQDPDADGVVDHPGAYSGFGLDINALPDLSSDTGRPLTFGESGKITFTASVASGTADVRFRLERIGSANTYETEPSCTMPATTITSSTASEYTVFIPDQARRTFEHVVMYIDTPDKDVTISNIMFETSPIDPTEDPVDCGSDAALFGDKELDMTAPFGDATIDEGTDDQGSPIPLFRVDSTGTNGFDGYAVNGNGGPSLLTFAPAAFGEGGQISFTASIPAEQLSEEAQPSVDMQFKFERQSSITPDSCKTEPSYTTEVISIGGTEQEYVIDIPEQGSDTYENFILYLLTKDTQVQISNITLTTTPPAPGVYVPPANCLASPLPSEYFDFAIASDDFDGDGITDDVDPDIDNDGKLQEDDPATPVVEVIDTYNYNYGFGKAAFFRGTYGGEQGGSNTLQSGDVYTFPTESAIYGGWSNDNTSLLPLQFNVPRSRGDRRIAFCASSKEPATIRFKFEDNPWPNNYQQVLTEPVLVQGDGDNEVIRPYMAVLSNNKNIAAFELVYDDGTVTDAEYPYVNNQANEPTVNLSREFTSLQMYVAERDVAVTIGKITGNWDNGLDTSFFSRTTHRDAAELAASGYCDDFPVPDTDGDVVKDSRDLYPNDNTRASDNDLDNDGIDDLLDPDIDGDGVINEDDSSPYGS
ncbi:MAG: hypothetical protein ACPG5F_02025 [Porticoccaceae bacterium]